MGNPYVDYGVLRQALDRAASGTANKEDWRVILFGALQRRLGRMPAIRHEAIALKWRALDEVSIHKGHAPHA